MIEYPDGDCPLTHRTVRSNGIDMHIAEAGEGPLVVLCHGFPELWYSWRTQFAPLVEAGFHVVAPDQRGYGATTRPSAVEAYDIIELTDDILGLMEALGEEQAVLVGHDWGAPVVWHVALRAPERVRGVIGMSVPYVFRAPAPPIQLFKQLITDTWFYILYFQEPGVADAELNGNPAALLRRMFAAASAGQSQRAETFAGRRDGRGMIDRMPEPEVLPGWLEQHELDYYIGVFSETGFTGGLNWYRNLDRNWERTESLTGAVIEVPAAFLIGAEDPTLSFIPPDGLEERVRDLRANTRIEGAGHWVQQERPQEVNAALLSFLASLPAP